MTASPASLEHITLMNYTYSVSNGNSRAWWAATPKLCHDSEKKKITGENMSNANGQPENIAVSEWQQQALRDNTHGGTPHSPRQPSASHGTSDRPWEQTLLVCPRLAASDRRVCEREDGSAFHPKCLMAAMDPCVYTGIFYLPVFGFTKVRRCYTTTHSRYTIIWFDKWGQETLFGRRADMHLYVRGRRWNLCFPAVASVGIRQSTWDVGVMSSSSSYVVNYSSFNNCTATLTGSRARA